MPFFRSSCMSGWQEEVRLDNRRQNENPLLLKDRQRISCLKDRDRQKGCMCVCLVITVDSGMIPTGGHCIRKTTSGGDDVQIQRQKRE